MDLITIALIRHGVPVSARLDLTTRGDANSIVNDVVWQCVCCVFALWLALAFDFHNAGVTTAIVIGSWVFSLLAGLMAHKLLIRCPILKL